MLVYVALSLVLIYYSRSFTLIMLSAVYAYNCRPSHARPPPKTDPFYVPQRGDNEQQRSSRPVLTQNEELNQALENVISHIKKAYISPWYSQVSPYRTDFSDEVDVTISMVLNSLSDRCAHIDWPQLIVGKILPIITRHMQAYSAANTAMKRTSQVYTRLSETDALQNRIASFYDQEEPLHPQINRPKAHLDELASKLVQLLLPKDLSGYRPSANFVQSIVGNTILLPVVNLLSNPDFWNQQVVKGVEKMLADSAKVNRLRKKVQLGLADSLPPLTPETDEEGFRQFLFALESLESVALARQTHYTVSLLVQRLHHSNIASQDYKLYFQRLKTAKLTLESRINSLDPHSLAPNDMFAKIDFNTVLSDAECIPLFTEFMKCQSFDYLEVYFQLQSLDTSSIDPLGGFEMEATSLNTFSKHTIISLYNSMNEIKTEFPADILQSLERFIEDPSDEHYVDVQRMSWRIRDILTKKLDEFMPEFKESVYFDQYMAVAGSYQTSVDRLQTDDITPNSNDINNELVHEAVRDAIGEKLYVEESETTLPDDIQVMLDDEMQDFKTKIETTNDQIAQLRSQMSTLKPLLDKAELTNDIPELRILRKSTASLQREIDRKILFKDQLSMRASQSTFFKNFNVYICGHTENIDSGGEYISYIVTVKNLADCDEWVISRRYRQFYALHKILRVNFGSVEQFKFPKKKVVLKFQQRQFAELRTKALNNYLSLLLRNPEICEHLAFRMFLTSESFPSSYYDYVPSNNEASSTTSSATAQAPDDDRGFSKPIAEIFLTLFNIDEKIDWIRGKAIVIVIQQILGGTIEKRIRDILGSVPRHIPELINTGVDNIWPDSPRVPVQRTLAERINSRDHSRLLLRRVIKAWLSKIVGVSKCDFAAETTLGMLQNSTLNRHLVLMVLDSVVESLCAPPEKVFSPLLQ